MQSVKKNNRKKMTYFQLNQITLILKLIEEFNNDDHHDAHEFLIWLLDNLNETIKEQNKKIKGKILSADSVWFILIIFIL